MIFDYRKGSYVDLFGEEHSLPLPTIIPQKSMKKRGVTTLDLKKIQTPLLIPVDYLQGYPKYDGPIPTGLIGFNECFSSTDYAQTVHFYLYDDMFTRVLRHPEKYTMVLSKFSSIIAPDFSVWADMSYEDAIYSLSASRAVANYYYGQGIKVIPNVQWSVPYLYDKCFANIPVHSIIAVNCMGIRRFNASKYLWRLGYKEMLQRLAPSCIIRYGDKMPGEDESISFYHPNRRLIRLRGGSHVR